MKKLDYSIITLEILLITMSLGFIFTKTPTFHAPVETAIAFFSDTSSRLQITQTHPADTIVETTTAGDVAQITAVPSTQKATPKAQSVVPQTSTTAASTQAPQVAHTTPAEAKPAPAPTQTLTETYEISVPSVGIHTTIKMDVNGQNMPEYLAALEKGAAHYKGTPYPGQVGSSLIFAHSTFTKTLPNNMDTVFRALHYVKNGDQVIIQNKYHKYVYEIYKNHVIVPTDLEFLSQVGPTRVTLMTCTPIGSTKNRLLVYAKQISAQ